MLTNDLHINKTTSLARSVSMFNRKSEARNLTISLAKDLRFEESFGIKYVES